MNLAAREERAARLGWKKVPSEDDPAGWCWLLPHGSTRASTAPQLDDGADGMTEEKLKRFEELAETAAGEWYHDLQERCPSPEGLAQDAVEVAEFQALAKEVIAELRNR